jgi:hypothetical protein
VRWRTRTTSQAEGSGRRRRPAGNVLAEGEGRARDRSIGLSTTSGVHPHESYVSGMPQSRARSARPRSPPHTRTRGTKVF